MQTMVGQVAGELGVREAQIEAALRLFSEGATVPFIARYRKEATGGLDADHLRALEQRLRYLREFDERRTAILRNIEAQGRLTPELRAAFDAVTTKAQLEDLYLPYKSKKRTRASVARDAGLEPLADALAADPTLVLEAEAERYVDPGRGVADRGAALDGARWILIERLAEDPELLGRLRQFVWDHARLQSRVVEGKQEKGAKFADYFNASEPIKSVPAHRALALFRGRKEGILRITLGFDTAVPAHAAPEPAHAVLQPAPAGAPAPGATPTDASRAGDAAEAVEHVEGASADAPAATAALEPPRATPVEIESWIRQRLGGQDQGRPGDAWLTDVARRAWRMKIFPHLQVDIEGRIKDEAEQEAIRVFSRNLQDLLLAPPAGGRVAMGLDPGLRTGVKAAVVDATGAVVGTSTVYPHQPRNEWEPSIEALAGLIAAHGVELVAIGNGTGARETDRLVADLRKRHPELAFHKVIVSEAGASVYSASKLAARELPDLDITIRGAVSIARRLQDPLAELVKIEPRSIGVGQYQHDVNQAYLSRALDGVVEDCVNAIGVEVNTASPVLLRRVAGLNQRLAETVVAYRSSFGPFTDRQQFRQVPGFGDRTFEQAAGFLRIANAPNPLDSSAVHPEAYALVERMCASSGHPVEELIGQAEIIRRIRPDDFADERFGPPTIRDVLAELEKPGRDPRPDFRVAEFKEGVNELEDLQPGMTLEGVVTNVTDFGAFVDIGVHQDGLVHVSRLANRFVKDPREVVRPGTVVRVKVVEVDLKRRRIALSMRFGEPRPAQPARPRESRGPRPPQPGVQQPSRPRPPARSAAAEADRPKGPSVETAMSAAFSRLLKGSHPGR